MDDEGQVLAVDDPRPEDAEPGPDPERAPYGWTRDRKAPGGWRAKKRPGRGGRRGGDVDQAAEAEVDPDRDPEPAWRSGSLPTGVYEASDSERAEVSSLLALVYSIPADFLITVDPYCFGALNANLQQVIDATVPILCRSQSVVRWITGSSGLMMYAQLAIAMKPVAVAIWQHHVTHSVALHRDEETGQVFAAHRDFSAYTAA
jgi:hypothetical protein